MSGTQESVQLLIPFLRWRGFLCKGTKTFASGKVFGSGEDAIFHMRFGMDGIGVTNSAGAQILTQPSLTKTPADKGPAAGLGKLGVVDITQRRELFGQTCDIRRPFPIPTAFARLSRQIACQFRLCGRIFADIMQRQLTHPFLI